MQYDNLDPLYKILCLALIFLVPLIPAWGLYKIAPEDKFLANGNFSGFKINATGSAAIYIVLFAAIYVHTNSILDEIDSTKVLKTQIISMKNDRPWLVKCNLKLLDTDRKHEIPQVNYADFVHEESIICFPRSLKVLDGKMVQFYLDNEEFKAGGDTLQSGVFINGFGTTAMPICKKSTCIDKDNHIITFNQTFQKTQPNTEQLRDVNLHRAPVYSAGISNSRPPTIPN